MKVLLICPWVIKVPRLRAALRANDIAAELVRVDFEAALRAALSDHHFVLVVYMPTPGLSCDLAMSIVRHHAPRLQVIELDHRDHDGASVVQLLRDRCS